MAQNILRKIKKGIKAFNKINSADRYAPTDFFISAYQTRFHEPHERIQYEKNQFRYFFIISDDASPRRLCEEPLRFGER